MFEVLFEAKEPPWRDKKPTCGSGVSGCWPLIYKNAFVSNGFTAPKRQLQSNEDFYGGVIVI